MFLLFFPPFENPVAPAQDPFPFRLSCSPHTCICLPCPLPSGYTGSPCVLLPAIIAPAMEMVSSFHHRQLVSSSLLVDASSAAWCVLELMFLCPLTCTSDLWTSCCSSPGRSTTHSVSQADRAHTSPFPLVCKKMSQSRHVHFQFLRNELSQKVKLCDFSHLIVGVSLNVIDFKKKRGSSLSKNVSARRYISLFRLTPPCRRSLPTKSQHLT